MVNRQGMIDYVAKTLDEIYPKGKNGELFRQLMAGLSDAQVEALMVAIEKGEYIIPLYAPNFAVGELDVDRNIAIGKKMGHSFFEHLILTDPATGVVYKTPKKYMVLSLPLRKQRQMHRDKVTIPEDNKHVDDLTGQPTGVSKGSSLSYPELQILYGKGLSKTSLELIKFRGGDEKAFNQMNKQIIEQGGYSQLEADKLGTRAKATDTLSTLLTASHIRNNA